MHTIWRSLLWREWHEHKWKLAALSAILLTVQVYCVYEHGNPDIPPIVFWFLCLIPGAFFVGVRTATGERTSRTLEFTRALPIKTWQAAAVKLGMAAVACLLPIVFSILLALGVHFWKTSGGVGPTADAVSANTGELQSALAIGLVAAGMAISVLIWATAAAIGQPNELRGSAAAAAAILGWPAALLVTAIAAQRLFHISTGDLGEFALAAGPCGFLVFIFGANFDFAPRHQLLDMALQLSSLIAVTAWTLRRFGQPGRNENRAPSDAASLNGGPSAIARTNWRPLTALAWKQWRESVPLCLAGLVLVASFAVTRVAAVHESLFSESGLMAFRVMVLCAGAVTAIIVGIGSFASDLHPDIWAFWRSRPISVSAWFWIKYLSGSAAVLLFLDGPLVALDLLGSRDPLRWLATDVLLDVSLPLHLLAYTAAVCASCWVRQGVYAGIFSFAALLAVLLAPVSWPSLGWLNLPTVLDAMGPSGYAQPDRFFSAYMPFVASMLALIALVVALAWLAVRFDLGAHRLARFSIRVRLSSN